jgi:hypothetical protein
MRVIVGGVLIARWLYRIRLRLSKAFCEAEASSTNVISFSSLLLKTSFIPDGTRSWNQKQWWRRWCNGISTIHIAGPSDVNSCWCQETGDADGGDIVWRHCETEWGLSSCLMMIFGNHSGVTRRCWLLVRVPPILRLVTH